MSAIDDALDALLEHRIAYEMVQIQYDGRADLARIRASSLYHRMKAACM